MMSKEEESAMIHRGYWPTRVLLDRYQVTAMTLHRWLNHPEMGFPKPVKFGRHNYWHVGELQAWELARLRERSAA